MCFYSIHLIARSGKHYTIGEELILLAVTEEFSTQFYMSHLNKLFKLFLSTVITLFKEERMKWQIIHLTLCNLFSITEFSLQIDLSTLTGNESLFLPYVHFINDESTV